MNSVNLIGRLVADGELRYTTSGTPVTNLRLAVQKSKDEADFFDVVVWEKSAEFAATLQKGQRVGVSGRLSTNSYEKDGQKITKVQITAFQIDAIDRPKRDESEIPF